ncbi:MAG: LysR family transcriptional regulator [Acidobacteriota bacterium]|nr:LysR family transcriptional regulator [Acidobacteriota bacterium]
MRHKSTLDQWAILSEVVRRGSYQRAAHHLHMSQSSVSYALARLQSALGIPLLRMEGRKAVLSPEGEQLLQQAMPLLRGFTSIETDANHLARGEQVELCLAVDNVFPDILLFPALRTFQQRHPAVQLTLLQQIRLTAEQAFEELPADLCIVPQGALNYSAKLLYAVELLAVAHRNHPLHAVQPPLTNQHLAEHTLVQIASSAATIPLQLQIEGCRSWIVNAIPAAHAAVTCGACFGWLPRELIQEELASGELKALPLATGAERVMQMFLMLRHDLAANSPALALGKTLETHVHRQTEQGRQSPLL